MPSFVLASIGAQNTYTDWIRPTMEVSKGGESQVGFLEFSLTGTWAGTVVLQKRYTNLVAGVVTVTDPIDVDAYTANTSKLIESHSAKVEWRAGIKTGGYTSGTAVMRLDQ
jgi:hypothetical protein